MYLKTILYLNFFWRDTHIWNLLLFNLVAYAGGEHVITGVVIKISYKRRWEASADINRTCAMLKSRGILKRTLQDSQNRDASLHSSSYPLTPGAIRPTLTVSPTWNTRLSEVRNFTNNFFKLKFLCNFFGIEGNKLFRLDVIKVKT